MTRIASGSEDMLCTAPTARVCTFRLALASSGSTWLGLGLGSGLGLGFGLGFGLGLGSGVGLSVVG